MKRHYLVIMDLESAARALALIESIYEHDEREFEVLVMCLDDHCERVLEPLRMPQLRVVSVRSLGLAGLQRLGPAAQRRCCVPAAALAFFGQNEVADALAVLDARCYLFADPSVLFAPPQLLTMFRSTEASRCSSAALVLKRGAAEQGLLQHWDEAMRQQSCAAELPAAFVALGRRSFGEDFAVVTGRGIFLDADEQDAADVLVAPDGSVTVGGVALCCVDFSGLCMVTPDLIVPQRDLSRRVSESVLRCCVRPYVDALTRADCWLRSRLPEGVTPGREEDVLTLTHSFVASPGLREPIIRRGAPHLPIKLDGRWDAYASAQVVASGSGPGGRARRCPAPVPDAELQTSTVAASGGPIRVSALVSTYAAEDVIGGCLKDLVDQTLFSKGQLEIVVVDSGSPQNEGAIVQEFLKRYPNIKYLRTTAREGVYMAWNRAARAASGRYLSNANTDDRHRADAFEIMADALDANPEVALVYADSFVTKERDGSFGSARLEARFAWPPYLHEQALHGSFIGPQPMWRRRIHDEVGWFDARYRVAGDYEMWLRIAERYSMLHLDDTLGLYQFSDTGVEVSNRALCAAETQRMRVLFAQRAGVQLLPGKFPETYAVHVGAADAALQQRALAEQTQRAVAQEAERRAAAQEDTASTDPVGVEATDPSPRRGRPFACSLVMVLPLTRAAVVSNLSALVGATPRYIDFEVVLVDRGSDSGARSFIESLQGDVTLVRAPDGCCIGSALRLGLAETASEVVVLLDESANPTEGWLDPLLRALELVDGAGVALGRRVVFGQTADEKSCLGALAIRKVLLEQLGVGSATSYASVAAELCRKVEAAGWGVELRTRSSLVASARAQVLEQSSSNMLGGVS